MARQASRISIRQLLRSLGTHLARDHLCPRRMREEIERRQANLKRHRRETPSGWRRLIEHSARADGAGALCRRLQSADRARSQQMVRDVCGDERTGAGFTDEIALMKQLVVCAQYRQARNAKIGRETSGRWNPLSRPQAPLEDGAAQPVVDLAE